MSTIHSDILYNNLHQNQNQLFCESYTDVNKPKDVSSTQIMCLSTITATFNLTKYSLKQYRQVFCKNVQVQSTRSIDIFWKY